MRRIKNDFINSLQNNNPNWELLLVLADMYSTGKYGYYQSDDVVASSLYNLASKCPCNDTSAISIAKLINMRLNPLDISDRSGEIIDPSDAHEVIAYTNEWLNNAPDSIFIQNKRTLKPKALPPPDPRPLDIFFTNVGAAEYPIQVDVEIPQDTQEIADERLYKQSSHDSGVTPATKTNIKKIKEDFPSNKSDDEIVNKAIVICNDVFNRGKKDKNIVFTKTQLSNAHEVIVSLVPFEYASTGVTQVQILGKVLQKIESIDDMELRTNIEETLAKRMASGIEEGGLPVCGTGKISRIMSVFEGVDENVQKGIPIDIVKREISQLAAKIRDDYMAKIGPEGRKAYSTELSVPQYAEDMSKLLHDQVTEEYVTKLKMSPSVISPLIKTYSDAF